jgi:hypothetical protein
MRSFAWVVLFLLAAVYGVECDYAPSRVSVNDNDGNDDDDGSVWYRGTYRIVRENEDLSQYSMVSGCESVLHVDGSTVKRCMVFVRDECKNAAETKTEALEVPDDAKKHWIEDVSNSKPLRDAMRTRRENDAKMERYYKAMERIEEEAQSRRKKEEEAGQTLWSSLKLWTRRIFA